jgi:hypothetical protein
MNNQDLVVFKGKNSQTGQAFVREFPDVPFAERTESFDQIRDGIKKDKVLTALPIWNSHQGEIAKAKVIAMLFEDKARICRLWPQEIRFSCITRKPVDGNEIKTITSIIVAQTQCSVFLDQWQLTKEKYIIAESTTDAYNDFHVNGKCDAVLCAPSTHDKKYHVFQENAANPLNMTAFVLLGGRSCNEWLKLDGWENIRQYLGESVFYAGVEMPIPDGYEEMEELFEQLVSRATSIDSLPRIVFAARRSATHCAIIVEAADPPLASSLILESGEADEIEIHSDLGSGSIAYSLRAQEIVRILLNRDYRDHLEADFICHSGKDTYFFACPKLGMITHGFEKLVVEKVFRQYVTRCFGLIDNGGITGTKEQLAFYEKYKTLYYEQDVEFIKFTELGIASPP